MVNYVRTDHIGRPVFATDSAGTKVWEASYYPFGEVLTHIGANITLRFPGQWFQAESGLHQNWMRDYDPTTGRYLQADSLGLVDGASVYGYARQNPGRYVDPTGEFIPAIPFAYAGGMAIFAYIMCEIYCEPAIEACGMLIDDMIDDLRFPPILNNSGQRPSKTPNTGPPGSRHVNPGSGQIRDYGPDGRPIKDIDFNHDHGQGIPHVHDWDPDGTRGPGRPVDPEKDDL